METLQIGLLKDMTNLTQLLSPGTKIGIEKIERIDIIIMMWKRIE